MLNSVIWENLDTKTTDKAKGKELTPLTVNKNEYAAEFLGSEGEIYETQLNTCTCPAYQTFFRGRPCKHMARLAMELGLIPSDGMQTDYDYMRSLHDRLSFKRYIEQLPLTTLLEAARGLRRLRKRQKLMPSDYSPDARAVFERYATADSSNRLVLLSDTKSEADKTIEAMTVLIGRYCIENDDIEIIEP